MPEPRELVLIRGSHRLTPRSRKDVTTSCSARPQQHGPWPQPQPTWAGCSWRKRCVLRRPGTGRRISGWRRPATPGGSAGPAAGREWGPVVADRPPAWCLLVKTVPSIPGTLPRAVCPPRPQDSLGPLVRSARDDTASSGSLLLMRNAPWAHPQEDGPLGAGSQIRGRFSSLQAGGFEDSRARRDPLHTGPGVPTGGPTDATHVPSKGPGLGD